MNQKTLAHSIHRLDEELEDTICRRFGVTLDEYKAIRFALRFLGIGIVALWVYLPSVEPSSTALLVLAAFVLGPSVVEAYFANE